MAYTSYPFGAAVAHHSQNVEGQLKVLADLVKQGLHSSILRHLAVSLVQSCPDRSDSCEVSTLFYFVQQNIRIIEGDARQSAEMTAQRLSGSGPDRAVLLATLLSEIGFPAGFRAVDTRGVGFHHVYVLVGLPKRSPRSVIALDTFVASAVPGWEPSGIKAKKDLYPLKLG